MTFYVNKKTVEDGHKRFIENLRKASAILNPYPKKKPLYVAIKAALNKPSS